MLSRSAWKTALLVAAMFSMGGPALAAGKWVRQGNTEIIAGPTKKTKAVLLVKDPGIDWPDPDSYALVAYLPSGKPKNKLRLGEINHLSVSYSFVSGLSAGGSPRMSIVIDVNRDGEFSYADDEIVYVNLGEYPFGTDEQGDFIISGNLINQEARFTNLDGTVTHGTWDEILDLEVNGLPVSEGAVDSIFTILDFAGDDDIQAIAVTAMQVNKAKLNPKAKIPVVD